MSDNDDLNDLDDIEDEDFKAKKIKKEKNKKETPEERNNSHEEEKENIFVTNNPKKSTSYKEKLLKVYSELEAITDEEIQTEINDLKKQILDLVNIKNESDEKIRSFASKEIDEKMTEDKDMHYLPKTKPNVIRKARDEDSLFSLTNILLVLVFVALLATSLILLIKL